MQNDEPLTMVNDEWVLSSFTGRLSIEFKNRQPENISLFEGNSLIFKLKNNWVGDGIMLRRITKGHFIVIAPNEWEREGPVSVAPESCVDSSFAAHYLFHDGSDLSSTEPFPAHEVASFASGLKLEGDAVFDDSQDGSLFVGVPPQLTSSPSVVWARVGEEKKTGWNGENFKSAEMSLTDALNHRQGHFFVRIYDREGLLDSDQFRFLRDLQEIQVNGERYTDSTLLVPSSSGYSRTVIRFVGADGAAAFRPILQTRGPHTEEVDSGLVVTPDPKNDKISVTLEVDGGAVDVVLDLPRIWWRMEQRGSEASAEWRDSMIEMTRREFRALASSRSILRLRLPKRVLSVSVGFGVEVNRNYRRKGECVELPLVDFLDYQEIRRRLTSDEKFNILLNRPDFHAGHGPLCVVRIPADPVPTIVSYTCEPTTVLVGEGSVLRWTTRHAEDISIVIDPDIGPVESDGSLQVTPSETTTYKLRLTALGEKDITSRVTVRVRPLSDSSDDAAAQVRRLGDGWRRGKGFSCGELLAVCLTAEDAKRQSLTIDKRRKTTHRVNIEALQRMSHV